MASHTTQPRLRRRAALGALALTALAACAEERPTSLDPSARRPAPSTTMTTSTTAASRPPKTAATPTACLGEAEWAKVRSHWSPDQLVTWDGKVDHIFFHDLIPFPEKAFSTPIGQDFDDWYLTRTEAERVLSSLHANGFVLVPLDTLFVSKDGVMRPNTDLHVPMGKKPLVISVDDMSFNKFLLGKGFMDKLVIDEHRRPSAIGTDPRSGKPVTERRTTMVGLIDAFICEHPDFSLNGAAGTLALTGYEGILGYRTNRKSPTKHSEHRAARPVADLLRRRGWSFACHSYGHVNLSAKDMTVRWCADDTRKWLKEVGPLVGPTNLYITAFGAYAAQEGPVMQKIYDAGFKVICPVSDRTAHQRLDSRGAMYQGRLHIDGHGVRYSPHIYEGFFDPTQVFDTETRLDRWKRKR